VETPKPFADAPWREDSGLGIASQDVEPFALVFLREQNDEFKSSFHLQVTGHTSKQSLATSSSSDVKSESVCASLILGSL
jgi:hypothetical protein